MNDSAATEALIDEVVQDPWRSAYVLVNNAGITRDTLAMRMKDDAGMPCSTPTSGGVSHHAAIRPMMKQRFGRIISITSVVGASGNPGQVNYAAAKAGVTRG